MWPPVDGNLEINKTREFNDKTRDFCHFWPFSWATANCVFLGSRTISTALDPPYTVIWKSTKLVNFVISCSFHGLLRTVLGSGDYFNGPWPLVHGNLEVDKTREFCHFWTFSWAIAHCFGSRDDFNGPWPPVHGNLEVDKTREFFISGRFEKTKFTSFVVEFTSFVDFQITVYRGSYAVEIIPRAKNNAL